jgi:glycosyltransferase involved in cell wall biosynthesis
VAVDVSVILPVLNGAGFVAEAVASVRAQNRSNVEIIAVDDGSTDGSAALLKALGVPVFQRENEGPSSARNEGLSRAQGDVFAFIDHDDLWPAGKLDRQLRDLETGQRDIVFGQTQRLRRDGASNAFTPLGEPLVSFQLGSALVRRSVFDRVGGFDEGLRAGEDYDFFLRAWEAGARLFVSAEVALLYRLHSANLTFASSSEENFVRLVGRSVARRRAAGAAPAPLSKIEFDAALRGRLGTLRAGGRS